MTFIRLEVAQAQNISVELGSNEIGSNESYTITLKVNNGRLRQYGDFPDISGFEKAGTSTSSSTNIVQGKVIVSQSVTQSYLSSKQGTFVLPPFTMSVNGETVISKGATIQVVSPRYRSVQRPNYTSPLDELFGQDKQSEEFVNVPEKAFLSLTNSKDTVYVGEGFTITLALYISDQNQADLQFYKLSEQLAEIQKQLTPSNVWEENFAIENINRQPVEINGEGYRQYKFYQATFYPNSSEVIEFPSIALKMIKYKKARNPSFFGRRRKQDFITFKTKPILIVVKELPNHPLQASVAVGNYQLKETITRNQLKTGHSFTYIFAIQGEGNINYIAPPKLRKTNNFDFYDPMVEQTINRSNNRVTGQKVFSYHAIPNEPGTFNLKKYLSWIFFNPRNKQYDTLFANTVLQVKGESLKNRNISTRDVGSFYNKITSIDNTLKSRSNDGWLQLAANILIVGMLILTIIVVFKK
ncbi:MAG: BatD family protein [Bacteroidota bacterium]